MIKTDNGDQYKKEIAFTLATRRKKMGLSQKDVAEKLGTKTPDISRLESGKHNFSIDSLYAYAGVLDCRPAFVMEDAADYYGGVRDYELKIFDEVLAVFSLEKNFEGLEKIEIKYINEDKAGLMPIGLELNSGGLKRWIKARGIQKNRAYVNEILESVKLDGSITGLIEASKALSLNDSYWIDKTGSKLIFKSVNLYENNFNDILSLVAFVGMAQNIRMPSSSPELTTGGMLRKGWRRISGRLWLYKGGSLEEDFAGSEPFSEYYASQIAGRMEIKHVEYDLKMWKGILASCCPLFTNKDVSYVPIGAFPEIYEIEDVFEFYRQLGDEYYQNLCDMLVFDALIYNTDRHFGNFGLLRDNASGSFIDAAPVFDNGQSLFVKAESYDFENLMSYRNKCSNPYERDWDYILRLALGERQKKKLKKLTGFKLPRHPLYNLGEYKLQKLDEFIQMRAYEIALRF